MRLKLVICRSACGMDTANLRCDCSSVLVVRRRYVKGKSLRGGPKSKPDRFLTSPIDSQIPTMTQLLSPDSILLILLTA